MNLQFEQTLASLNSKVQNIFGLLCRIWDYIKGEYDFVASMDGAEQESNSEQFNMAPSKKEAILAKDTLIYVLQMLGFVINIKKSVLEPLQKIDFLGVEIDSVAMTHMTTSLPQEKVELIRKHCQDIMGKENVSIRELTSLVGRLSSTAIAVLPAPLQYRYLQRNQIQALSKSQNFDSIIPLSPQAKGEITWWIENLSLSNGRSLLTVPAQLVISSDASLQGWGQHAQAKQQGVHGPD